MNKDLNSLIVNSKLSKVELRKNLYLYFSKTKEYDIVIMKNKVEDILDGKLNLIPENIINGLIKFLSGEEVQAQEIENKKSNLHLQDMYNRLVVENNHLKRENENLKKKGMDDDNVG